MSDVTQEQLRHWVETHADMWGWQVLTIGGPGAPDLLLLRQPDVLAVFLHSPRKDMTALQARTASQLEAAGVSWVDWRPSDLRAAQARIQGDEPLPAHKET